MAEQGIVGVDLDGSRVSMLQINTVSYSWGYVSSSFALQRCLLSCCVSMCCNRREAGKVSTKAGTSGDASADFSQYIYFMFFPPGPSLRHTSSYISSGGIICRRCFRWLRRCARLAHGQSEMICGLKERGPYEMKIRGMIFCILEASASLRSDTILFVSFQRLCFVRT